MRIRSIMWGDVNNKLTPDYYQYKIMISLHPNENNKVGQISISANDEIHFSGVIALAFHSTSFYKIFALTLTMCMNINRHVMLKSAIIRTSCKIDCIKQRIKIYPLPF